MARFLVDVSPLRKSRNLRLLFLGHLISQLGSNLTLVAVPFQAYRETHSSLWVGLVSVMQLPFLIAGSLWGGSLGDRIERRRLFVITGVLQAVALGLLALNAQLHTTHIYFLIGAACLATSLTALAGPIRTAAIPNLVQGDDLVAAYSVNQVIMNLATVVGPAIAGVLLASIGLSTCYVLDGVTFLALAVCARFMSPMPVSGEGTAKKLFASIRDGFSYVRQHAIAQAVYLADLNAMVFGLPRALFPAVALTMYHAGPRTLGLLYAAPGIGALALAFGSGWIVHVKRQGRLVTLAIVTWGGAMAVFGTTHTLWLGLTCLAVAGSMDVISTVLRNTILQNAIADEFRSRISSIQLAVVTGGPRLGDVESGVVANLVSTQFSIVSGGLACVVGVLLLVKWRPQLWLSEKPLAS